MRNLPSDFDTETSKKVTTPVYLIEIYYAGVDYTLRTSTRQEITLDGFVFKQNSPHLSIVSMTSSTVTLQIVTPSATDFYNTLNSSPNTGENKVKIWAYYGTASEISLFDAVQVFNGYIDEVPVISKKLIKYNCLSGSIEVMWTPRILIGPPLCNHIPADGTVIGNITLERK